MAEETQKYPMTPEQITAAQEAIFNERNVILDRLMPQFFEEDSLPACVEASKYLFAYFSTQIIEGLRMSRGDVSPDAILDEFIEGFKAEVMNIHSQILMSPAMVTAEDLKKVR